MRYPRIVSKCFLTLAFLGASVATLAADPSMAQIYQAAEAGQLVQAQTMIQQVLQDHPNSAKAHYVHAELLARQNLLPAARGELQIAEKLAPGLPFAKASAVASLQTQIATAPRIGGQSTLTPTAMARGPGIWLPMLALAGILMAAYFFFRARNRLSAPARDGMAVGAYGPGANVAPPAYNNPPFGPAMPAAPAATGGGMGSSMLGALAAGAAAGAGMVAGQALMHRMMDGNGASTPLRTVEPPWDTAAPGSDMGGDHFGIAGAGSWDDAGSGGDNNGDWS